jgi:cyclophilin family peptidyl-prolyl cis-trans isomerase
MTMMKRTAAGFSAAALVLTLTSCSGDKPATPAAKEAAPPKAEEKKAAPPVYVEFETSKGKFVMEVHEDWAPIGTKRFLELVNDKFFDGARFFRIVPNFVVQFGLAASPAQSKKWDKMLDDDPVARTNSIGTVAFATAGPNTRTTQIFINMRSNQMLDDQGFAPFARVTEGMDVVGKFFAAYGERPDQDLIKNRGNAYLTAEFPSLDYIRKATIVKR